MRMYDVPVDEPPELGDMWWESPLDCARGFRCVGVEETSRPTVWDLHLERLNWPDFEDALAEGQGRERTFVRRRR